MWWVRQRTPSLAVLACSKQIFRSFAVVDLEGEGNLIRGAQSSVTKSLWVSRMAQRHQAPELPLPKPQPKAPQRSEVTYPFSSDPLLREEYRNPWGFLRVGHLLEDLDSLAGNIAYLHCDDGDPKTRPPLLVTASVDKISLRQVLSLRNDLVMSGQVAWSGNSSLDIEMHLSQGEERDVPLVAAWFTFVARHPDTHKATAINPLVPQTDEEKAAFAQRQALHEQRKAQRRARHSPDCHSQVRPDRDWADSLLVEAQTRAKLPSLADNAAMLMRDTALSNTFTCQPQQQNLHGRIFGGFLMRRAYELAFATTYSFGGSRPSFVEVDEVTFKEPVDVGNLLNFRSRVLHVHEYMETAVHPKARVHVEVVAYVTVPEKFSSVVTNTFNFVFCVDLLDRHGHRRHLKRVLPSSKEEAEALWKYYPGQPS